MIDIRILCYPQAHCQSILCIPETCELTLNFETGKVQVFLSSFDFVINNHPLIVAEYVSSDSVSNREEIHEVGLLFS